MRAPSRVRPHAQHHVVAEAHDRGARHRLDVAVAAARLRRARSTITPPALGHDRERRS